MPAKKYKCPCCGYYTLIEEPSGTFEICPVCYLEDDGMQYNDPNYEGGANKISLKKARENFTNLGASTEEGIACVRSPYDDEK